MLDFSADVRYNADGGYKMKRYIRSAKYTSDQNVPEYNIEVYYSVDFDLTIAASTNSSIKPVRLPNGKIDQQALADYDAFADNVYEILCYYFDVVDVDFSDKSDTSRYFYMYARDENGELATKFIIRLRLSDHNYENRHNTQAEHRYVNQRVQTLKQPNSKKIQRWKLENIVVNQESFLSYFDAEDAIESKMQLLQKNLLNKNN